MTKVRSMANGAAVWADSWSWRLCGTPLFGAGAPTLRVGRARAEAPSSSGSRLRAFAASGFGFDRAQPYRRRSVLFYGSGLAAAMLGSVGAAAWGNSEAGRLLQMSERLTPIAVFDLDGRAMGALPRSDALHGRDASGRVVIRTNTPVNSPPREFLRLAGSIEGEGVAGISPHNLLRASACFLARELGIANFAALRLKEGKCAGASTLLAQAVRSLTDSRAPSASRKLHEIASTVALAVTLPEEQRGRFIADTLYFGDAEGQPIIGVQDAARTVFGEDVDSLEPYQLAYLSALLLIPARLNCTHGEPSTERFSRQIDRAEKALRRSLYGDPRLSGEVAKLRAMSPIGQPAPDRAALEAGLRGADACRAATGPLGRLEAVDSSVRIALKAELRRRHPEPLAGPIRLTVRWPDQARFKAGIEAARAEIASRQSGAWLVDPRGQGVAVLAATADETGALRGLYQSSAVNRLDVSNELGSLAKLPALVILAEQGWGKRAFCNREAVLNGHRLHNAGGDPGVKNCGAGIAAEEVWGRSLSLAVYDALQTVSPTTIRQRLSKWQVHVPLGTDPRYALAFGLVDATPADFAAFLSALSAGNVGKPAVGYKLHVLVQPEPSAATVDLRDVFGRPDAARLIASASSAALTYRGPRGSGTLLALGLPAPSAIAKSGTLDDHQGRVRFKAAAGGLGGRMWMTMVLPQSGALGSSAISILPLAKRGQDAMIHFDRIQHDFAAE